MEYGKIIVAGALTVTGLMFTTPFAEAVTGSVAGFTTGFEDKLAPKNPYAEKIMSVQTLYDMGERNLTKNDAVEINGIKCWVLQVDEENKKAELITAETFYFNALYKDPVNWIQETNRKYPGSSFEKFVDEFYINALNSDEYIIDSAFIHAYGETRETMTKKVHPLSLDEAESNYSSFSSWNIIASVYQTTLGSTDKHTNDGFWLPEYKTTNNNIKSFNNRNAPVLQWQGTGGSAYIGARPVFWITLESAL